MQCPRCGRSQPTDDARFCRGCGVPLGEATGAHARDERRRVSRERPEGDEEDACKARRVPSALNQGLALLLLTLVVAIVMTLLRDFGLVSRQYVKLVVSMVLLAALARIFYPYMRGEIAASRRRFAAETSKKDVQVGAATSPFALPDARAVPVSDFAARAADTTELVGPASVTENTTKLLEENRDGLR